MAKKLYFKIGEACKKLDIQPYVLRYWETEFPVLEPRKSRSGQRTYTEEDLAVIRRIKQLLYDEGYTIAGAKKKLEAETEAGVDPLEAVEAHEAGRRPEAPAVPEDDPRDSSAARALRERIRRLHRQALEILERLEGS